MEIVVTDYLSDVELKEIAIAEFKSAIRKTLDSEKEVSRIIYNLCHEQVVEMVNETLNDDIRKVLSENTVKVINDLSAYTVFKKADAWERQNSLGYDYLQECIEDNKPLIKEKVAEVVGNHTLGIVKENLPELISVGLMELLKES